MFASRKLWFYALGSKMKIKKANKSRSKDAWESCLLFKRDLSKMTD